MAVLDWELSTTGHPLADLAYALSFYFWPNSVKSLTQGNISNLKDTAGMKLQLCQNEFQNACSVNIVYLKTLFKQVIDK